MSRFIVGTAGHIDHGKTTLIKALSGITTDRLREEQKRGISIVSGYAYLTRGEDVISIIDVPGHERFIKNMLSGITGIDLVLFVVAADEGVMPQTREHFDIVRLLDIKHGMFLITKSDLAPDFIEMVEADIADLTEGTHYADFPVVAVSAFTGQGLDEVRAFVFDHFDRASDKATYYPRLNVDRLFKSKGHGDIVTGSLEGADLSIDTVLSQYPGGDTFKIRSMESHDKPTTLARMHSRVALNLSGERKAVLEKGAVLSVADKYAESANALVRFTILPAFEHLFKSNHSYKFYFGSAEVQGKAIRLVDDIGEILLESPQLLFHAQKAIIRSMTPVATIGRLEVLDSTPLPGKKNKRRAAALLQGDYRDYIYQKYPLGLTTADLEREFVTRADELDLSHLEPLGLKMIHPKQLADWQERVEGILGDYYAKHSLAEWMEREDLRQNLGIDIREDFDRLIGWLSQTGVIETADNRLKLAGRQVRVDPKQAALAEEIRQAFDGFGLMVPDIAELKSTLSPQQQAVLDYLIKQGELKRINPQFIVKNDVLDCLKNDIIRYTREKGEIDISDVREITGLSRKYVVPYLEYFDSIGVTKRRENKRVLTKEYQDG
ncbi:MAG TPA: selenocysteine-specific translation elongation factor [Tissierellia bacterium]|nr:selenocysteine-specific translation elongation factor [Tissierellia bacterium]